MSKVVDITGAVTNDIRSTAVDTDIEDDYIINTTSLTTITLTLPSLSTKIYHGRSYVIIKQTDEDVIITTTATYPIWDGKNDVTELTMDDKTGERVWLINNGERWYTI